MGRYVNIKCGSCSRSLTGGYTADFYSIGQPYVDCKKCGTPNRMPEKCTEWDLMSSARKTWLLILMATTSIFWAVSLFVFAVFLYMMNDIHGPGPVILIAAGSLAVAAAYRVFQAMPPISASRKRMVDPSYRRMLTKLGFI